MKQQIIEGGESPLIPHKMDDRFKSPEPKRDKSKTPIIQKETPLNDDNLNQSRDHSSYITNGDSSKINKQVMSLQINRKRTLDIPMFDAYAYGTNHDLK